MKKLFVIISFFLSVSIMNAQTTVKLSAFVDGIMLGKSDEKDGKSDSYTPELTIYLPDSILNKKMAVIICPGGGYSGLAIDHEGHQFAKWLQSQGIAGIVLKYRMPNKHSEIPLDDFKQAMHYVKSKSMDWNISTDKIGVAGFSAGGHLASTASTHLSSKEDRPDFSILFYPVITMGEYTHLDSKTQLLGDNPTSNDVLLYSNETRVNEFTPPTILLLSDDDRDVSPMNSIIYYEAMKDKNVDTSMYIFPVGGHGWGMLDNFEYHDEMLTLLKKWLSKIR